MGPQHHLLRLIVSCRKITAQVTLPRSNTIVAMTCSSDAPAWLGRFPRPRGFWDSKTAARVGEKLGARLKEIGVFKVEIDAGEEIARPLHHRMPVGLLFQSLGRAGVEVDGVEKLKLP